MIRFIKQNKFLSLFVFIFILLGLYYFWINRKPYTTNAFVVANIRPISAIANGPITKIYVKNNQEVKKGDPLFTVFTEPYELALQTASQAVVAAEYEIKAIQESIKKLQAVVKQQEAEKEYAEYRSSVQDELEAEQMTAMVQVKQFKKQALVDEAALEAAEADLAASLQRMQQALAKKQSLETDLRLKQLRLSQTTVYAQNNGIICNLFIAEGRNVAEGEELFAFIDTRSWWIQANLKETVLTHVKPNMKARITFPMYPGQVFIGTVQQLGWSVNRQQTARNGLPVVEKENEWFLLPQRFPVQISLDETPTDYPLHVGMSANVQIETGHWQWPSLR